MFRVIFPQSFAEVKGDQFVFQGLGVDALDCGIFPVDLIQQFLCATN
jgi:hypothetical protein